MQGYVPLDVDTVASQVTGTIIGPDLRYFAAVDSTNRVARDLSAGEWRNGTVVLTDYQEAGRGRQGRTWTAPPGSSVLLSVILTPPAGIRATDSVMAGALAVEEGIREETGLAVGLKWPNDVLVGDRKVCGILAEADRRGAERIILGIGLNGNFDTGEYAEIPDTATTLQRELGHPVDRESLAAGLLNRLDLWYRCLTHDPDEVFGAWASRLETLGRRVTVIDGSGAWQGVATDVHRDGGLLVRDEMGEIRTVYAADVSVRDSGGYTTTT